MVSGSLSIVCAVTMACVWRVWLGGRSQQLCAARVACCVCRGCVCVCVRAHGRGLVCSPVLCVCLFAACSPCQPVYHSKHNDVEARMLCGMSMLPLKKGPRGPAGTLSEGACNHRACIAPRAASCCLVVAVVGGVRVVLLWGVR